MRIPSPFLNDWPKDSHVTKDIKGKYMGLLGSFFPSLSKEGKHMKKAYSHYSDNIYAFCV